MDIFFFFFFFFFLYSFSSAIMSWSSTRVLFLDHWAPSVQGTIPKSIFVDTPARTRTVPGAMSSTSANALTTSATETH